MPRFFNPRKSGAHRIACIALYRALLLQARRIPLPAEVQQIHGINPIKYLTRKEFRKHAPDVSPRRVVPALERGYAAEALLRTAGNGDSSALSRVHSVLLARQAQASTTREYNAAHPPKQRPPRVIPAPFPGAPKVLESRPLPFEAFKGRRHVPILAAANGQTPFLRIKKPQSPFLTRVIKDKVKTNQKRLNRIEEIQDKIVMGEWEDAWERDVREIAQGEGKDFGVGGEGKGETGWTRDLQKAQSQVGICLDREQRKSRKIGDRMLEIVDKERELREKEKRQKMNERWKAWLERRKKRQLESDVDALLERAEKIGM